MNIQALACAGDHMWMKNSAKRYIVPQNSLQLTLLQKLIPPRMELEEAGHEVNLNHEVIGRGGIKSYLALLMPTERQLKIE